MFRPDAGELLIKTNENDTSWKIDPSELQFVKEIGSGSFGAVYTVHVATSVSATL